jgi:hypothetical protein
VCHVVVSFGTVSFFTLRWFSTVYNITLSCPCVFYFHCVYQVRYSFVSLMSCESTIPSSSACFFGPGPLWISVADLRPFFLSSSLFADDFLWAMIFLRNAWFSWRAIFWQRTGTKGCPLVPVWATSRD